MPIGTGAAILGSALIGGGASLFAGKKQSKAAEQALALQRAESDRQQRNFQPYLGLGQQATGRLGEIMSGKMDNFFTSPDYQFRFGEGMRGLENSAASRGGLLSGNFLRGATSFGQGLASNEFQNYWNRNFEAARLGQSSAAGSAASGTTMAGQMGNTVQSLGAAHASGPVGAANALTGGVQNYLLMNALANRPGSVYSGSSPIGGFSGTAAAPNYLGGFF